MTQIHPTAIVDSHAVIGEDCIIGPYCIIGPNVVLGARNHLIAHVVIDGDTASGRSYALNIRWDPAADRFWVARVSANKWHWQRTDKGWKVVQRINSNLDGAEASRALLAPQ